METRSEPEEIIPGLSCEWLYDRRVVVYTLKSASREVVDAWVTTGRQTAQEWPSNLPYLALHDISAPNLSLTPYARQQSREALKDLVFDRARSAVVMPKTIFGNLIRLFIQGDLARTNR